MSMSLSSSGNRFTNGNGSSSSSFYVPAAWRYVQYHRQHGSSAGHIPPAPPRSPSPPLAAAVPNARLPTDLEFLQKTSLEKYKPEEQGRSKSRDPRLWSRDDVRKWLLWCQDEFDLPPIDLSQFSMNGKALCLLMKTDFNERAPRAGDVLYNAVHLLLLQISVSEDFPRQRYDQQIRMYTQSGGHFISSDSNHIGTWATALPFISSDYLNVGHVIHQSNFDLPNSNRGVDSTVTLSPAPSTDSQSGSPRHDECIATSQRVADTAEERRQHYRSIHSIDSGGSDSDSPPPPKTPVISVSIKKPSAIPSEIIPKDIIASATEQPVTNGRLLWDFLHQLLNDSAQRYNRCITWKERSAGVFKIVDPHGLAQLWGMQKNHLNMNFDKMSRALRYYYRVNILKKVQGERHCYQFLRQPTELKACKQRALINKYNIGLSKRDDKFNSTTPVHIKCEGDL